MDPTTAPSEETQVRGGGVAPGAVASPTGARADAPTAPKVGVWSTEEHERYLQAKFANPKASWKEIARLVGTRSARQVILHDQKFRAKMDRRRSKFERAMAPRRDATVPKPTAATAADQDGMRYFDTMGVLLLASVASTRSPRDQEIGEPQRPDADGS